jgi:formylglycine-generating enzyme required for sulfatase activity
MIETSVQGQAGGGTVPQGARFSNLTLRAAGNLAEVTFDVTWDHSFRYADGPANWDALWVFIKYSAHPTKGNTLAFTEALGDALDRGDVDGAMAALDAGDRAALLGRMGSRPHIQAKVVPIQKGTLWLLEVTPRGGGGVAQAFELERITWQSQVYLRVSSAGNWNHARVDAGSALTSDQLVVEVAADHTGAFLYRGPGNLTARGTLAPAVFQGVKLQLGLGEIDMSSFDGELKVWPFGLEMVYVSGGPFALGDPAPLSGSAPANCFYDATQTEARDATYRVVSEAPIPVGTPATTPGEAHLLWYDNDDDPGGFGDQAGPVPAAFPKGYQPFYLMKRQVTQGQYADFLNTLYGTYAQGVRHPYTAEGVFRGTLHICNEEYYTRVAIRPDRACNFLCWADGIAFAAWAGLRPMTELEYEKACRGPASPRHGEYAWGSTTVVPAQVIVGPEDGRETVTGNCNIASSSSPFSGGDGGLGPVRDDAFAALGRPDSGTLYAAVATFEVTAGADPAAVSSLTARETTGSSYYGVAALTGNLWELCVTAGNPLGRAFTGDHGQGLLTRYGEAPTADQGHELSWPGPTAYGYAWRGGSWYAGHGRAPVAARPFGSGAPGYGNRSHDSGFRAARTAPVPAAAAPAAASSDLKAT